VLSHTQNPFPFLRRGPPRHLDHAGGARHRRVPGRRLVDGRSDFRREGFLGLHAHKSELPDSWRLDFPDLDTYRDEWLRQAQASQAVEYAQPLRDALFRATNMRDIDLRGDTAVCHKKFDGTVALKAGGVEVINWQTLYFCARIEGRWKITGFVGYMPFPMGKPRG
jgi:hypothetical protein